MTRGAPFDKTQKRLTGKGVKHFCFYWHHLNQEQALTSNGLEEFNVVFPCQPLPAGVAIGGSEPEKKTQMHTVGP